MLCVCLNHTNMATGFLQLANPIVWGSQPCGVVDYWVKCKRWQYNECRTYIQHYAIHCHLPLSPLFCSSDDCALMFKASRKSDIPVHEFTQKGGFKAWDVYQLYPQIQQPDLIRTLHSRFVKHFWWRVWNYMGICLQQLLQLNLVWCKFSCKNIMMWFGVNPTTWQGLHMLLYDKTQFTACTPSFTVVTDAKEISSYSRSNKPCSLLTCSYILLRFGESVWKQTRGIPMSISPAVFMANLHMLFHEYKYRACLVDFLLYIPPGQGPVPTLPPQYQFASCCPLVSQETSCLRINPCGRMLHILCWSTPASTQAALSMMLCVVKYVLRTIAIRTSVFDGWTHHRSLPIILAVYW